MRRLLTRARRIAGAGLVALVMTAGAAVAAPLAETARLPNGLEIVVIPDHRVPVVTHMVWYRVGAADEVRGKSGLAHFLEHLMFKGTEQIPPGEFSRRIARLGGQDNAFTSRDYTAYFQRVAKERLADVMAMEADRMANLRLTDEVVLPERDVILEERSERTDSNPGALFYEQMAAALWLAHPYGVPIIGWRAEMAGLSREDALAFYDRHYGPDNAILIVAGDVTLADVLPLAEAAYGPLPARGIAPRARAVEPPPIAARRLTMSDPRVKRAQWMRLYLVPSYATDNRQAHVLQVADTVLGGGETSLLYRSLVEDRKLALAVSTYYDGDALDETGFSISALPAPGVSFADLEVAIDEIIRDLAATGPAAEDLTRAQARLRAAAVFARDNQATMARIYGTALTTGQTVADVEAWPDRIAAVTAEEVRAAVAAWLVPQRAVTGELTPPPEATP